MAWTMIENIRGYVGGAYKSVGKLAKDDPRRVVHSLKVALALTLVSLFYYFQPLYLSFGVSAMWAVITVVVVFEFYVGATLGKGLNRALATLLGGVLGVGAHLVAGLCSKTVEPILVGLFVFLLAVTCTFLRFFPKMKARYDYGLLMLMLTFCMISITGVRQDAMTEVAHMRVATIAIGALTSLLVSALVCPVWAGQDLHNLVARNIEIVANYLEGFATTYIKTTESSGSKCCSLLMQGYKSVLISKGTEETLANFASWEPPHGKFKLHHPWNHYLKLGALARKCSYRIDTLNAYVNSEIQGPLKIREEIQNLCVNMSLECSKALKQIATALKAMASPKTNSVETHIASSKECMERLREWLDSAKTIQSDDNLITGLVPAAIVAVLVGGIVECTEEMVEATNELASKAGFDNNEKLMGSENDQQLVSSENSCTENVIIAFDDSECNGFEDLGNDLEINGQNVEV